MTCVWSGVEGRGGICIYDKLIDKNTLGLMIVKHEGRYNIGLFNLQ